MRILMVTPGYPPLPGGGERYVRALATGMAQRGHEVTVFTSDALSEADFWRRGTAQPGAADDAVRLIRCRATGFPGGRPALLIWRKAMVALSALPGERTSTLMAMSHLVPAIPDLEERLASLGGCYDVAHGFNLSWEHAVMAAWAYARREAVPLVITPFMHFGAGGRDRVALNMTMDHQRRVLREAQAVLTLTAVEREGLLSLGLSTERVTEVGAGLDAVPELRGGAAEEMLRRYGLQQPLITYIGRLSADKGVIHAAEAARALRSRGLMATLVLVGRQTPEFARYYRRLDDRDQQFIRPLGLLEEADKHTLLAGSCMLVLPSRVDSFGIVLLEAWAHGLPVIGARAGGIPGVIAEGQDGLLVDYGDVRGLADAMAGLLADPSAARSLGERGRRKVAAHYTWDAVCERVLAVYARVTAGNRAS